MPPSSPWRGPPRLATQHPMPGVLSDSLGALDPIIEVVMCARPGTRPRYPRTRWMGPPDALNWAAPADHLKLPYLRSSGRQSAGSRSPHTHYDRLFKIAHLSSQSAGRLAQLSSSFFCFRAARQVVDDTLQVVAVLHGRCDPRGKSSLPAPLKLSLKVKWNSAHSQSSVFVVAPAHGHNARGRLKACLELTSRLPGLAESHRGLGA